MTKKQLLKILEQVKDDDAHIFVNSSDYNSEDDSWWGSEWETEIKSVEIAHDQIFITVEASSFDHQSRK